MDLILHFIISDDEFYRSSLTQNNELPSQIINGKPAERRLGDWAQMKSSKGKVYYFHLKTHVNQWVEPAEWKQLEEKERLEEEEAAAARIAALQGRVYGQCKIYEPNLEIG